MLDQSCKMSQFKLQSAVKAKCDEMLKLMDMLLDYPLHEVTQFSSDQDHAMIFIESLYSFHCLPVTSRMRLDWNEDSVWFGPDAYTSSRQCTAIVESCPIITKWYYRASSAEVSALCSKMNEPISSIIMGYRLKCRNQWLDTMKGFRNFHLDVEGPVTGEIREFVDKLEREVVRQNETNTCLFMACVRYRQMYTVLKKKTLNDVSHDLLEDYMNPFEISERSDVIYDSDHESESVTDFDPEQHGQGSADSSSDDCTITNVVKKSRNIFPAFKSLVNGAEVTAKAKKFAFYDEKTQQERNITIIRFLEKMKATNVYEIIKMIAIIHFNGFGIDKKIVPIPDRWPDPTGPQLRAAEKMSNNEHSLNFHACVFLFDAIGYLLGFDQSTIPAMVAVSILLKGSKLEGEIVSAAKSLPTLKIPTQVCGSVKCHTGHEILYGGAGVQSIGSGMDYIFSKALVDIKNEDDSDEGDLNEEDEDREMLDDNDVEDYAEEITHIRNFDSRERSIKYSREREEAEKLAQRAKKNRYYETTD